MRVPKAPSWPIIIIAGLVGSAVNNWLNSFTVAFLVFAGVSAVLMLFRKKPQQAAKG